MSALSLPPLEAVSIREAAVGSGPSAGVRDHSCISVLAPSIIVIIVVVIVVVAAWVSAGRDRLSAKSMTGRCLSLSLSLSPSVSLSVCLSLSPLVFWCHLRKNPYSKILYKMYLIMSIK